MRPMVCTTAVLRQVQYKTPLLIQRFNHGGTSALELLLPFCDGENVFWEEVGRETGGATGPD